MMRIALILSLAFAPAAFADDGGLPDAGLPAAPTPQAAADAGVTVVPATAMVGLPDGGDGVVIKLPTGAPEVPTFDGDGALIVVAKAAFNAVQSKDWGKLTFLIITFLVWLSRLVATKFKITWLASGGAAIVKTFAISFAGMLAATWGAGQALHAGEIWTAAQFGFGAAGGWSILEWLLGRLAEKFDWAKWLNDKVVGAIGLDAIPGGVPGSTTPPSIPPVK